MTPPLSFFGIGAGSKKPDPEKADTGGGANRNGKGSQRSHRRKTVLRNAPTGELQSLSSGCWDVTLWDISRGGLCLISRAKEVAIPASESLSVRLYDPLNRDSLRLRGSLSWIRQEGNETLIGLEFRPGTSLPKGCFLERYLSEGS
jgi:hypothetical protein